jgi:hypothetical protein
MKIILQWKCNILLSMFLLFAFTGNGQTHSGHTLWRKYFQKKECNELAFTYGMLGYKELCKNNLLRNVRYLTIIDFTKSSSQKRFFVLDLQQQRLVLSSVTAHGIGSDPDSLTVPRYFGNTEGSKMSSVGFYITGDTYTNHRPSDSTGLCLFGVEQGFNDSAAAREVVIHYGATEYKGHVYITDSDAARSYGCPALPLSANTPAINLIKGGSCLFIYSDKVKQYAQHSPVLNSHLPETIIQQGPPPNNCRCALRKGGG